MSFTVIIPARYGASRLPGKPLLDIGGKPMLQHTFERACQSKASNVFIATDDERIQSVAKEFGAHVLMTSESHLSGTDRLQEAAAQLGLNESDVIVNVQGDEPLIPPSVIDQVAENIHRNSLVGIATLCEIISEPTEIDDSNSVKVVFDKDGIALYFSRSTIPHHGDVTNNPVYRHIGVYAYRVDVLNQFVSWPPSPLETAEKLEQLRALHNGVKIHVDVSAQTIPPGVDTLKDIETVRAFLELS